MSKAQSNVRMRGRVWQFAKCEFAETSRKLWLDGKPVVLRDKPIDLLVCLLNADGAAVEKSTLIQQVWLDDAVTDDVIKTAVNSLRNALGDRDKQIIRTVHRVGYRLGVPISVRIVEETVQPEMRLASGEVVPGRPDWQLDRPLGHSSPHWVWLVQQIATRQVRVFKFAEDGIRYGALQREITLSRLFEKAAPHATCFVRVFDWRLTTSPYFLESEFGGINLLEWAAAQRELGALSRQVCLQVMADLCDAVDIAHEIGVFHNDLKPSNILISGTAEKDAWRVKLADFGIATLLAPQTLSEFDVTSHGFGDDPTAASGGTLMYRAPEVKQGNPSTRSADIYSLGVILFQLLAGDFMQTPAPGWQESIDDPILRQDIEQTVNINAALRIRSAAELASRLRTVEVRRIAEETRAVDQRRADLAIERYQANRARQPYLIAIVAVLLLGLAVSLWFYRASARDRNITQQINSFLTDDLLRQSNPQVGRGVTETLSQAIEDVTPLIDQRFPSEPRVAAMLHDTIARALDNGENFDAAGKQYDLAAADWIKVDGPLSQDAIFATLRHVFLEARSLRAGSLQQATRLLSTQTVLLDQIKHPSDKLIFARLNAEGMIALESGELKIAESKFEAAVDASVKSPDIGPEIRMTARQRVCIVQLKAGEAALAETCFRNLITQLIALDGADSGNVQLLEIDLSQAFLLQGKLEDAIRETNIIYPSVVRSLGPDNTFTLQVLATRAAAEGSLERWDDSIRDDLAIADVARKNDPSSFFAIGTLSDASLSECRSGKLDSGEQHAREALQMVAVPGHDAGLAGAVRFSVVSCILLGKPTDSRLTEADRLLDEINVAATEATAGDPAWGANVFLARAQLALARRQYSAAAKLVATAAPAFNGPTADRYQRQVSEALTRAIAAKNPSTFGAH